MKVVYGVEHKPVSNVEKLNEFNELFKLLDVLDLDEELIIVKSKHEYDTLIERFKQNLILEENYKLYQLDHPVVRSFNQDYGFISEKGNHFLYEEMVRPFQISQNTEEERMAMLQMEEHIVAIENASPQIYFTDRQQEELISKIASAYNVNVTFL